MRLNIAASPSIVTPAPEIFRVSPSRIGVYQDCHKKFDFVYRKGLKRKGSKAYFDLGNYIHELMHVLYQTIQASPTMSREHLALSIKARVLNDLRHAVPGNIAIYNQAKKHLEQFILQQSPIIDQGITVLDVEAEFDVPVTLPSGRSVNLFGFADLIYRSRRGHDVVRDHKSTGNTRNFSQAKTDWDNQLLHYGACHYLLTGRAPAVEFNIINTHQYKGVPTREQAFPFYRSVHSDKVYENYLKDTFQLIDEMLDSKPTPNYSRDCSSCPFNDVCSLELKGASAAKLLEVNYERRDPLETKPSHRFTPDDSAENTGN